MSIICSTNILDWSVRNMLKNQANSIAARRHPQLTPYWAAGLSFSRGRRIVDVPYDPYFKFLFDGEEFDLAMRLFTWGYDVYAPNVTVLYHYYTSPEENHSRNISKFWDYQWGKRFPIMFRATRRLRHKVGIKAYIDADPLNKQTELDELDKYGTGTRRTVQQYLDYAGIDLVKKQSPGACKEVRDGSIRPIPWNRPFPNGGPPPPRESRGK